MRLFGRIFKHCEAESLLEKQDNDKSPLKSKTKEARAKKNPICGKHYSKSCFFPWQMSVTNYVNPGEFQREGLNQNKRKGISGPFNEPFSTAILHYLTRPLPKDDIDERNFVKYWKINFSFNDSEHFCQMAFELKFLNSENLKSTRNQNL